VRNGNRAPLSGPTQPIGVCFDNFSQEASNRYSFCVVASLRWDVHKVDSYTFLRWEKSNHLRCGKWW